MAKLARERRPRLTPAVMRRALMADRWVARFQRAIRLALDRQVRETAREARIGMSPGTVPHTLSWAQELENAERPWVMAMAAEGYELAGAEFGLKSAPALGKATVDPVTAGVGASFLQVGDYAGIDRWVATTAAGSAATTAKQLEGVYKDAAASRDPETGRAWTNREIAQQVERRGLASNPARSLMLARTGSIWAMNEGAHQRYKRMGVTVEKWITTVDDARCPWCAQMHGRAVRTDDPFWRAGSEFGAQVPKLGGGLTTRTLRMPYEVQHPPLHPNCRCTMVPVITQEQAAAIAPAVPPTAPKAPKKPKPKPARLQRPIAEQGSEVYDDWRRSLSFSERKALRKWLAFDYEEIRAAQIKPSTATAEMRDLARALKKAMDRSPRAPSTVWRGLSDIDARAFKKMATADEITFKAFASTSGKKNTAGAFAESIKTDHNILFKIEQVTGTHLGGAEYETLMSKGSSFKVLSRKWTQRDVRFGAHRFGTSNILEITMKEVI